MTFIASPPSPAAVQPASVRNDGFFPDLDPIVLRQQARLDGTVTDERFSLALLTAMADVNRELQDYKARQQAAGIERLAEVPGTDLGSQRVWCIHYRNAVLSHIAASLAERHREVDTTPHGADRADELEQTAATHRRNLRWAISTITGQTRTTVELI